MGKRILIADDSRLVLTMLGKALQQAGFTVISAAGGEEALSILRKDKVDAVVLDAVMPQTDGFEACRLIRADPALASLPVMILTGSTSAAAQQSQADLIIEKTASFGNVISELKARLGE